MAKKGLILTCLDLRFVLKYRWSMSSSHKYKSNDHYENDNDNNIEEFYNYLSFSDDEMDELRKLAIESNNTIRYIDIR